MVHRGGDVERALTARPKDRHRDGRITVEAGVLIRFRETVHDGCHLAPTWSKVIRCRRSATSDTSIEISYGGALTMSTWLISGRAVRSWMRSAIVVSVKRSAAPEMAMSTTWLRAINSLMIGRSVSTGNVVIASTFVLYLVDGAAGIGAEFELDQHCCMAFSSDRQDLLDAVDVPDGLLDPHGHTGFDLFRRRPEVGHLDSDPVEIDLREDLLGDTAVARSPLTMIRTIMRLAATGLQANQPMIPCFMTAALPGHPRCRAGVRWLSRPVQAVSAMDGIVMP